MLRIRDSVLTFSEWLNTQSKFQYTILIVAFMVSDTEDGLNLKSERIVWVVCDINSDMYNLMQIGTVNIQQTVDSFLVSAIEQTC